MAELNINGVTPTGIYAGSTAASAVYYGNVKVWEASSPFDVVDSSTFNRNYQIKWSDSPIYDANYCVDNLAPNNPMVYRKLDVNENLRILKYRVYGNVSCVGSTAGTFTIANTGNYWPCIVTIYDTSLNSYLINTEVDTSTNVIKLNTYTETSTGSSNKWYYFTIDCDVTLEAGKSYWWPLFPGIRASTPGKTQYGYYSGVSGDLMCLRQWDVTNDSSYPPIYAQTTNRPYLMLTDVNNKEYTV